MNLLPNELIIIIFEYIQKITDKRQFLKTCKTNNKITKESMLNYEDSYEIKHFDYWRNYCAEKFTLELCHDSYFNMIPDHYINKLNAVVMPCAAYYNNILLLDLCNLRNCCIDYYLSSGINYFVLGGHISILEWCIQNNYYIHYGTYNAIRGGHIHVLKWLQSHKYNPNFECDWWCDKAIYYGHLNILKFLREIGCPWNSDTYKCALKYGNEELIKWVIDNGCPTS